MSVAFRCSARVGNWHEGDAFRRCSEYFSYLRSFCPLRSHRSRKDKPLCGGLGPDQPCVSLFQAGWEEVEKSIIDRNVQRSRPARRARVRRVSATVEAQYRTCS
jgi:hypothetical protein